jgi:hypothetical protein
MISANRKSRFVSATRSLNLADEPLSPTGIFIFQLTGLFFMMPKKANKRPQSALVCPVI